MLQALLPATTPSLSIDAADVHVRPDPPEVGETVTVDVTVRNRSLVASPEFDVQLFDGDPEAGGLAIGAPQIVDALAGGSTRVLTFDWDTTGLEGAHTLYRRRRLRRRRQRAVQRRQRRAPGRGRTATAPQLARE